MTHAAMCSSSVVAPSADYVFRKRKDFVRYRLGVEVFGLGNCVVLARMKVSGVHDLSASSRKVCFGLSHSFNMVTEYQCQGPHLQARRVPR